MIKAALLDFDGTLVTEDITSVLAEIVGQRELSDKINDDFHAGRSQGLTGLIQRINLLKGVTIQQIDEKLDQADYLMAGAVELMDFFHEHKIVTILASGNLVPVLERYQKKLGIDYVIGATPHTNEDAITGISEADFPHGDFKLAESQKVLDKLGISASDAVAIGDSPGDKSRFEFAGLSIAINPKGGVETFADYTVHNDLRQMMPIIERYLSKGDE